MRNAAERQSKNRLARSRLIVTDERGASLGVVLDFVAVQQIAVDHRVVHAGSNANRNPALFRRYRIIMPIVLNVLLAISLKKIVVNDRIPCEKFDHRLVEVPGNQTAVREGYRTPIVPAQTLLDKASEAGPSHIEFGLVSTLLPPYCDMV